MAGTVLASLGIGLLVLAGFARHQRGRTDPLVEPGLFHGRTFPASLVGSLLFFAVTTGLLFVLVLNLQLTRGASPTGAALALLPWSVGLAIGSWTTGAVLVPRFGPRVLRAGLVLVLAGLVGVAVSPTVVPLLVTGLGLGTFTVPFFANALGGVAAHETGSASGLLNAVQQLGATVGVALLGSVFFRSGPLPAVLVSIVLIAAVLACSFAMVPRRSARNCRGARLPSMP